MVKSASLSVLDKDKDNKFPENSERQERQGSLRSNITLNNFVGETTNKIIANPSLEKPREKKSIPTSSSQKDLGVQKPGFASDSKRASPVTVNANPPSSIKRPNTSSGAEDSFSKLRLTNFNDTKNLLNNLTIGIKTP